MCTLTWLTGEDAESYSLFFNRDELKTRKRAIPPALQKADNGINYIAPIDADAGGTWLAVNEHGVTVCLLNDYSAPEPEISDIHSRGEVVKMLAGCLSVEEIRQKLEMLDLTFYRGFQLVVFHKGVYQWLWNTKQLSTLKPEMPITSSSYNSHIVSKKRFEHFQTLGDDITLEKLAYFHSCHIDDNLEEIEGTPRAVHSVCMHRDNAETVSQCFVQVNAQTVSVEYTDGSPCNTKANQPLVINRLAVA